MDNMLEWNGRLSIKELKVMVKVYRNLAIKLKKEVAKQYKKGYIKGRKHGGTLLNDIDAKDLVL